MAYWSLAFEFHKAILSLIEQKFYGAAFALVRPIIEATVRAHVPNPNPGFRGGVRIFPAQ